MKKFLVFAFSTIAVLYLSLIPGMEKRMYGGGAIIWPYPVYFEMDGYYLEGTSFYKIPDMKISVDGFLGGGISFGYAGIPPYSVFGTAVEALAYVFISKEDWYFNLFGYKVVPALRIDGGIYYSIAGANIPGYSGLHEPGVGIVGPSLGLSFFAEWTKGKYVNFFFWPLPITIYVNILEY